MWHHYLYDTNYVFGHVLHQTAGHTPIELRNEDVTIWIKLSMDGLDYHSMGFMVERQEKVCNGKKRTGE